MIIRSTEKKIKKKYSALILRFAAGISISLFFIWLTLKDSDLSEIMDGISRADYRWVLGCIGVLLFAHVVRTIRWGMLLSPLGKVSWKHLNRSAAVGFMTLILLPMRLGELGRPWLISRPDPGGKNPNTITMSAGLGTLVYERLSDGIFLTACLFILLTIVEIDHSFVMWLRNGAALLFLVFSGIAIVSLAAYRNEKKALSVASFFAGPFGETLRSWLLAVVARMIGGLKGPKSIKGRFGFIVFTVLFWVVDAVAIQVLARAFGIELTFVQAMIVLCTQVVGLMIPTGPGMLGTYQYFTALGLSFFVAPDVSEGLIIAVANVLWASLFVQQVGLGLLCLPQGQGSLIGRLASQDIDESEE